MAGNIVINLISNLIWIVFVYVATVFFKVRVPSLLRILLWEKFKKEATVCVTEINNPYDTFDKSVERRFSLVPFCEVVGYTQLYGYLNANYRTKFSIMSIQDKKEFSFYMDKNLIIIGGPRNNFVSRELLNKIDSSLTYQFFRIRNDDTGDEENIDFKRLVSYTEKDLICQNPEVIDYGVVIYCKNPYCRKSHILLLAGLSQCSTLAAIQWIQKIPTLKMFKYLALCDGFEAVISCQSINNQNTSNIQLVDIYELKLGE